LKYKQKKRPANEAGAFRRRCFVDQSQSAAVKVAGEAGAEKAGAAG
jgi:hypothetical protein